MSRMETMERNDILAALSFKQVYLSGAACPARHNQGISPAPWRRDDN